MEVTLIDKNALKIRGKNGSIIVDPSPSMSKTEAASILFLSSGDLGGLKKVEGYRIAIKEPGEYEISSIKIRSLKVDGVLLHKLSIDGVGVLLGATDTINTMGKKESELSDLGEYEVLVLLVNSSVNEAVIAELEPRVVILYGDKAKDAAAELGKSEAGAIKKYSLTREKMPSEMEVIVLG